MHCKEISTYVLPEKELRVLSPNFYIHVSDSDLYILTIGPPIFLLCCIGRPIVGREYIYLAQWWAK
jgi:hypothetical protein